MATVEETADNLGTPLMGENTHYIRVEDQDGDTPTTAARGTGFNWRRTNLRLMLSPFTDESGTGWNIVYGLFTLFFIGSIIGFSVPKNQELPSPFYRYISSAIGYTYFLCWSVSFYPQVITNLKRKTTQGLSADFCCLNVVGFACYSVYNLSFFYSPEIKRRYRAVFGEDAQIAVESNDVAFAVHAFILSSVQLAQIAVYDGIQAARPSKPVRRGISAIFFVLLFYLGLVLTEISTKRFNWLSYIYLMSYIKIGISVLKYIPQVLLNYHRKSTLGWNVWNVILDFSGGVLSHLQLILDCVDLDNFAGIRGNIAKFLLGTVAILFDIVFMLQHYVFYRNANPTEDEQSFPMLNEDSNEVM